MSKGTNEPEDVGNSALVRALILQMKEHGPDRERLIVQQCQTWDQTPGLLVLGLRVLSTDSCCLPYWAPVRINFQLTR